MAGRPYDKRRWRRLSARILLERPVCQRDGCDEPSTDVHHIDGKGPSGPLGYERRNLLALCHSHHSEITVLGRPKRKRSADTHPGLLR